VEIDPKRDVAVLQYTGGTTGTPKAAMLTHHNLASNTRQCMAWFYDTEPGNERVLAVLPFFHVFAMTSVMNFGLAAGAEIVLLPRFELKTLLKAIHAVKPTIFAGVPTIFTAINNEPTVGRYDLSSIKCCISGGAPLPVEVKAAFEALTGCTLVEGYGLSEASPVAACNPFGADNKAGSNGLPRPGTVIEILALDGSGRVLPQGERGEICVSGPQVMAGYWNRPEETAETLRGGRLHTGDVGYLDSAGYVFLVDRIKDLILCSGYNVYPRNVEEAIYQHPAVFECCVVGVPDEYRGQTVKAFIVLKPRRVGQNRVYAHGDRARLTLILRGKRLGFALADIKELLALYDADRDHLTQLKATLEKGHRRIAELERQREEITATIDELKGLERTTIDLIRQKESQRGKK
jgi:long-chain acyl-CoA synthetase